LGESGWWEGPTGQAEWLVENKLISELPTVVFTTKILFSLIS